MGNCCSDVETHEQAGGFSNMALAVKTENQRETDEAVSLLTGTYLYSSLVDISVHCENLGDADFLSESDTIAVMYLRVGEGWNEVARTECIANTNSPQFVTSLRVHYNFENVQDMLIVIVDVDKEKSAKTVDAINVRGRNFLGQIKFPLASLLRSPGEKIEQSLEKNGHTTKSKITLHAVEMSRAGDQVTMTLAGKNLKNLEAFSKSDPFVRLLRVQNDGVNWLPVYKTEVRRNNLDPVWKPIQILLTQLCLGDVNRPLRLEVYDHETMGGHKMIGVVETTVAQLKHCHESGVSLRLTGRAADNGEILVKAFQETEVTTFLDYIVGGTEISFIPAIDFTASNKSPRDPNSLHFLNPNGAQTPYEEAIRGVGQVLEFYDSDKMYPVLGFGGAYQQNPVDHCFSLSSDPRGMCAGIQGILTSYRNALMTWRLAGPTLFTPVITRATQLAAIDNGHLHYQCLLILTDGIIMDMEDTVDAIINASTFPLSIVIVGIGNEDFSRMEALDSDGQRLKSARTGKSAVRDIVQFVEFNKFKNNGELLASAVLAELPGQLLAYMRANNIQPPGPWRARHVLQPPPQNGVPPATATGPPPELM